MDEILQRRVSLRQSRLSDFVQSIKRGNEVGGKESAAVILKLKTLIDKLDVEVRDYQTTSFKPQIEVVNAALEVQIQAEDLLTDLQTLGDNQSFTDAIPSTSTKTNQPPKLDLPTFSGDQLLWTEFWDQFRVKVHEQQFTDTDKLIHLMNCLKGPALDTIAGLSITGANYGVAINALQRRYGSIDALIDAHYTALNNIQQAENHSASCRTTLDTIDRHLLALDKLGEPVNGNNLRALILGKFPEDVIYEHHLLCLDDSDYSTTNVVRNLHHIVRAMEMAVSSNPEMMEPPAKPVTNKSKRKKKSKSADVTKAKKSKFSCLFCNLRNHSSVECRSVRTIEERKQRLVDRCLNCLRRNHKTEECFRKTECHMCKGSHLLLFCPKSS